MNYSANLDGSKEIVERETDPLMGNIIEFSIDAHRALGLVYLNKPMKFAFFMN